LKEKGIDFPEILIEEIWESILNLKDNNLLKKIIVEYEVIVNPVYPMPKLKEVLQYLKDKNIILGIISNAQFYTKYLFSAFLEGFPEEIGFDNSLIFYSYEYNYGKPSLYLFNKLVEKLLNKQVNPENTLYVGNDMLNDIYTAYSLGIKTCLFAGDKRSLRLREKNSECKNLVPDVTLTELNQLKNIIH